jgi:2-amino-4-hydroxy-6-hydroxymethyldihydropteridine diphosphokinase
MTAAHFTQPTGKRVAIALGSNLGNSQHIVRNALDRLAHTPDIWLNRHSHLYQTVAVGPPQPDYINACAWLSTHLDPLTLLHELLAIERQFGRVRRQRWGARSLDLDLLLFDDCQLDHPDLQLPHPRMRERAFVLVPLAEIVPDWIDPVSRKSIADLVKAVDCSGVKQVGDSW